MNSLNMWRMVGHGSDDPPQLTTSQRLKNLANIIVREVTFQRTLRKCNTGRLQWIAHMWLIVGFAGAAITTTLVYVLNDGGAPFPLDNPVKIIGNMSAALLLFGGAILIVRRIFQKSAVGKTYFQDWLFLSLLFSGGHYWDAVRGSSPSQHQHYCVLILLSSSRINGTSSRAGPLHEIRPCHISTNGDVHRETPGMA